MNFPPAKPQPQPLREHCHPEAQRKHLRLHFPVSGRDLVPCLTALKTYRTAQTWVPQVSPLRPGKARHHPQLKCHLHVLGWRQPPCTTAMEIEIVGTLCNRARLQSCRPKPQNYRALAPEGCIRADFHLSGWNIFPCPTSLKTCCPPPTWVPQVSPPRRMRPGKARLLPRSKQIAPRSSSLYKGTGYGE